MAKKSMVNREVKRAKLVKQHASKRAAPVSYTHLTLPTNREV